MGEGAAEEAGKKLDNDAWEQARALWNILTAFGCDQTLASGQQDARASIETPSINEFKPILRNALEREVHLVEHAILRAKERLAEFEKKFGMSTSEFERRFHAGDLEETLDFIEWG